MDDDWQHSKKMLQIFRRRLQILEIQEVRQGSATPSHIILELEDLRDRIVNLEAKLVPQSIGVTSTYRLPRQCYQPISFSDLVAIVFTAAFFSFLLVITIVVLILTFYENKPPSQVIEPRINRRLLPTLTPTVSRTFDIVTVTPIQSPPLTSTPQPTMPPPLSPAITHTATHTPIASFTNTPVLPTLPPVPTDTLSSQPHTSTHTPTPPIGTPISTPTYIPTRLPAHTPTPTLPTVVPTFTPTPMPTVVPTITPTSTTVSLCPGFAQYIMYSFGIKDEGHSLCHPDSQVAEVGLESNAELTLDMGRGNEIIDNKGGDFYFYEFPNGPGIYLDEMEVSVAPDDGTENPGLFTQVLVWGDNNPDNNGSIPPSYLPEEADKPINTSDLHKGTGIGVDIGRDDGKIYRFVRIRTYPSSVIPEEGQRPQVDAIEIANFDIIPTQTPSPTIEPTYTVTPTETPTTTPAITPLPNDTPTVTPTPPLTDTPTPPPTDTPVLSPTDTPTPLPTHTSTLPLTNTPVPSPTDTPTPPPTDTPTPAPTDTPAPTPTDTPVPEPPPTDDCDHHHRHDNDNDCGHEDNLDQSNAIPSQSIKIGLTQLKCCI